MLACRRVATFLFSVACLMTAAGRPASAQVDPQAKFEPRSQPGTGQKFLQRMAGEWSVEKTFYPRSGPPAKAVGECVQAMIHEGRFLKSDFTFRRNGDVTTGMGLIGFESTTGRFTSVWTDSRSTRMSFRQSRDAFAGAEIVLFGAQLGEARPAAVSRTNTVLEDGDSRLVHRQFAVDGGQERLVMELIMTRKKRS